LSRWAVLKYLWALKPITEIFVNEQNKLAVALGAKKWTFIFSNTMWYAGEYRVGVSDTAVSGDRVQGAAK
jgi:hypothetical protein